jgi:predicted PurR-regulated permease PerM
MRQRRVPVRATFAALVIVLIVASAYVLAPFAVALIVAAWMADVMRPLARRLAGGGERRKRSAAAAVVALVACAVLVPVGAAVIAAIGQVRAGILSLTATAGGRGVSEVAPLRAVRLPSAPQLVELAKEHARELWRFAQGALGASTSAALAVVVFLFTLYALLAHGRAVYVWLARHAPIGAANFTRMAAAVRETGRGLIVGTGATVVVQGAIAGIAYLALGVTAAIPLALLTAMAGLIPMLGTMLVWVPVALGLALSGHPGRAVILVVVGLFVIGLVDNVVRPLTARFGRLKLPPLILVLSLLGGVTVFGAAGIVFGPLVIRLTIEALQIARERGTFTT